MDLRICHLYGDLMSIYGDRGNVLALVRPPDRPNAGELDKAPVTRTVVMATFGGLAALWAIATLISGS